MNTVISDIRLLKVGSCLSLSGKSTLTYHIGCTPEAEIQFRVYANSGSGFFSKEWISLNVMRQEFANKTIFTSYALYPLFRGKSVNTHGFLLVVLQNEGLVTAKDKGRNYEYTEPTGYMDALKALIDSTIELNADAKPQKATKKKAPPQ